MTNTITLARVHGPVENFQASDLATFDVIGDVFTTRNDSLYRAGRVQFYSLSDVWVQLIHQTRDGDSVDDTADVWITLRNLCACAAEYGPLGGAILAALVASEEAWVA